LQWNRDQFCQFPKVLGRGCEVELVLGAVRAAKTQAVEPQDALQVGEKHLDLLPPSLTVEIGITPGDASRNVARTFMDMPRDLPSRLVRRAHRKLHSLPD
jgi:hypothetical protein